jgi:hypothetical protein
MNKRFFLRAVLAGSAVLSGHTAANNNLNSFNPAIAMVLDGLYYHDNIDGEGGEQLEQHNSVLHSQAGHAHEHGGLEQGFNLRELEITLSGSVDSYFDASASIGLSNSSSEIEEAWLRSRSLPYGLTLKAGKFLSAIGYHNEKHLHNWDFADQNLAYLSLFGEHGLNDSGVQLSWLAPSATYLLIGTELLQGSEREQFGNRLDGAELVTEINQEFSLSLAEEDLRLSQKSAPLLTTGYIRLAPDLGTRQALQLGASISRHANQQAFHEEAGEAFISQGSAYLYGVQAVYKRFAGSAHGKGALSLQAEAFHFDSSQTATWHSDALQLGIPLSLSQQAAYLQGSWGFAPRWQVALRHAVSGLGGELIEDGAREKITPSRQNSAALTWQPTEFSKLRLQFNHNDISSAAGRESFRQIMLQYNLSLGAHSAHTF